MKVFCDDTSIERRALVTFEATNGVYREKNNELLYIEGSRTFDTLRYGKTSGKLPFEFTFTDRFNHDWKVVIDKDDDTVTMFIPCGTHMMWFGADDSPTRTGSDAQTHWAQVQFSYQGKTKLPPYHEGVRIAFNGYKEKNSGEWNVDSLRWGNILDLAKKGTEVSGAVLSQIEKGVAIAGAL